MGGKEGERGKGIEEKKEKKSDLNTQTRLSGNHGGADVQRGTILGGNELTVNLQQFFQAVESRLLWGER